MRYAMRTGLKERWKLRLREDGEIGTPKAAKPRCPIRDIILYILRILYTAGD
jgi:hypothetical protein